MFKDTKKIVQKNILVKKHVATKKIVGQKISAQINLMSKNCEAIKIFGQKFFSIPKHFELKFQVEKNLVQKNCGKNIIF